MYRVATGQVKEIDDTREYDVEEKISKEYLSRNSNHTLQNGWVIFVIVIKKNIYMYVSINPGFYI